MARLAIVSPLAFAVLAAATGAHAEDALKSGDLAKRLFAERASASTPMACFARTYDAAHLARNPGQKTASMLVLFNDVSAGDPHALVTFKIGMKFRGKPTRLENAGSCSQASVEDTSPSSAKISCGIDCDGGGLDVEMSQDNKSMRVSMERISLSRPGSNEDFAQNFNLGADDRVFRLDRVSLRDCLPLISDKKLIASVRSGK